MEYLTGGWHPAQACAHRRHRCRPPPPEHLRGVSQGQRRPPEGLQGASRYLPAQQQAAQGWRCAQGRGRRRQADRRPPARRQDQAQQVCLPHHQHPQGRGGQGFGLQAHRERLPNAPRGSLGATLQGCPREAPEGQGRGGRQRQEIDGCCWFFGCVKRNGLQSWRWAVHHRRGCVASIAGVRRFSLDVRHFMYMSNDYVLSKLSTTTSCALQSFSASVPCDASKDYRLAKANRCRPHSLVNRCLRVRVCVQHQRLTMSQCF